MEPTEPAERASVGGRPENTARRTLGGKAFGVIVLAGVAGFALILFIPGLDKETRVALSFILAPVVVAPIIGGQAGLSRGALVVGSALGGQIAALLYAAGQYGRFSAWLIAVEFVALLLAPGTLRMLRMARIPGVPQGEEMPTLTGVFLIVVLSPFALAAGVLVAMARFPVVAVLGVLLGSVIASAAAGEGPVEIVAGALLAALLALSPAGIRWIIMRARQPRG
jgi:hypothetical protein